MDGSGECMLQLGIDRRRMNKTPAERLQARIEAVMFKGAMENSSLRGAEYYKAEAKVLREIDDLERDAAEEADPTGLNRFLEAYRPNFAPVPTPRYINEEVEEVESLFASAAVAQYEPTHCSDRQLQEAAATISAGQTYLDKPKKRRGRPRKVNGKISALWDSPPILTTRRMSSSGPVTEIR
jgi:hypothetical protein